MLAVSDIFRFGRWDLDAQRRTLTYVGCPVSLNGRAFDLLVLLVERHGQVVTRDEIVSRVWQGLAVGENNLTVQMSTLRRVLSEDGGAAWIVTVPGRGYRFVGAVSDDAPPPPAPPAPAEPPCAPAFLAPPPLSTAPVPVLRRIQAFNARQVWTAGVSAVLVIALVLAAAGVLWRPPPAAPRLSIAVLPFRNLSADHTQDYLADALTDDLTTDLAHIPGGTVIARESMNAYDGKTVGVQEIGQALQVRYIVLGSLRIEDEKFHVNAQLVDAANGKQLWGSRFDVKRSGLRDVHDNIVRSLATALGFQLEQIESARSVHDQPNTPDPLDLFLRARAILDLDASLPRLTEAQKLLEQAIIQQPSFGDALAELGALLLIKVHDMDDPTDDSDYAEAREMIRRALIITPRNARALAARGRILLMDGKYTEASFSAAAALAIEPSSTDAEAVLANCAQAQGKFEEAAAHLRTILSLTPNSNLNKPRYLTLGLIDLVEGRIDEAVTTLHQAIAGEEDAPPTENMGRAEVTRLLLIAGYEMLGKSTEAQSMYSKYRTEWPNRSVWRVAELFNKSYASKPGLLHILDALASAGMAKTSDEHSVAPLPKPPCPGSAFDVTPPLLMGGKTLDTEEMAQQTKLSHPPIIIDIGRGAASPPEAIWYNPTITPESGPDFVARIARERSHNMYTLPIVIMGDGPFGCFAYLSAKRLVGDGYRDIAWYRGGEESWAAAGKPSHDRRLQ